MRGKGLKVGVILGAVLILVGIGTALYNLWPDIEYAAHLTNTQNPYPSKFDTPAAQGRSSERAKERPAGPRVVISRVGIDVRIFEGDPGEALRRGVYHHPTSADPGDAGNTVIAGHRNRRQFALLAYLRKGDQISVWWQGEEHCYRIERVFRVQSVQSEILARGDTDTLTLYTCTPRFLGDKRTVVVAAPVEFAR